MEHYYPKRTLGVDHENHVRAAVHIINESHDADLAVIENCLTKCNVNFLDTSNGDREESCLKRCYLRYFDSALLIEKEMTKHVFGLPIQ
ncbi:UNKNOWN [Stylonychia lemnae]|uniref:Mitochondrial import inner membrane translocase subunit n=1 Tax=Stylonychia lemnae TaxID=5949 RepID=A0A078BBD3_STYLE|nr:UNKNOWN [Stylonychia lemnae]|eukprot:CDW90567.1 UNKNOWN [Stylonychia lemnae]